jgi:hypothetical protein
MRTKLWVVSAIVITLTVIGTRAVSRSSAGSALQQARPVILTATVDFSQELHARPSTSPSTGVGAAVIVLSADRQSASYAFSFTGLTGPALVAHFHGAANFGANASVARDLCGTPATPPCQEGRLITGTWSKTDMSQPLTDALIDALLAGQVYLNIHTQANPGGELRGQVIPISPK